MNVGKNIEDIKREREDLSTFLIHLTRDASEYGANALQNIYSILQKRKIEARNPKGMFWNTSLKDYVKSVCFTEAPLNQIRHLIGLIQGRNIQLEPYGLVFNKDYLINKGANPVLYLNTYYGNENKSNLKYSFCHLMPLLENNTEYKKDVEKILPYLDIFGISGQAEKYDFYWEREWRYQGDFDFNYSNIVVGLYKDENIKQFKADFPDIKFISPYMSMEEIIRELKKK